MRLALAAVGAVISALIQLTVVPYLRIGDAQPDLVLVFAVTAAIVGDLEVALVWAFIGGLLIDLLAPRPLGMTSFMLLIAVAISAFIGRSLDRLRYLAPIVAVFVTSLVASALFLVLYGALRGPIPVADPVRAILPDALYSTAIAAIVGPIAVGLHRRSLERERVAW